MNSNKNKILEDTSVKCLTKDCDFYGRPESNNYCSACFKSLSKVKGTTNCDVTCDTKYAAYSNSNFTSDLQKHFIPMPITFERLAEEGKQLELSKDKRIDGMNPRQKLITYMYQSLDANRSPFKTTCMIFGQSGVGKSLFLNHFIGRDVLNINSFTSETRDVKEIVLTMKEPSLNVSNLQLTFVESPGYFDDKDDKQDEINYNSLKEYKQKNFPDCYPNLIFIVIQGSDNRFLNGPLKKFLEKLKKLDIICPSYPNVICLFTYASCFLNDSEENIEKKKEMLIDLCYEYLRVTVSVVYIENDCKDLKMQGDWTVLPDGTLQPLNVFECAKKLMKGNFYKPEGQKYIDPLGMKTLASFFKAVSNGDTIKVNVNSVYNGINNEIAQPYSANPEILGEICVGKGYDVIYDKIKESCIFEFEESEEHQQENQDQENQNHQQENFNVSKGFVIISCINEASFFFGEDSELNTTHRLNAIGLNDKIDAKILLNKKTDLNNLSIKSKLSYLREIRTHKLYIPDTSKLKISKTFMEAVATNDFPSCYTASDSNVTEFFRNFFERWGHFVVTSVYLGGSIEIKKIFTNKVKQDLVEAQLKCILDILEHGFQKSLDCGKILDPNLSLTDIELNWIGGLSTWQISSLENIETIDTSNAFKSWKASLTSKPSVLKTKMKLQSIADFVSSIDKRKGETCQIAFEHLLGMSKTKSFKNTTQSSVNIPDTHNIAAEKAEPNCISCFSGYGKIIVMKSYPEIKLIKELNVGDKVLSFETKTKKFIYSTVYMFAHKNETKKMNFLKISCKSGNSVTLSPKHLVYTDHYKVKHADQIKIGDGFWTTCANDSKTMNLCKVDAIEITESDFHSKSCINIDSEFTKRK
ncbi:uncharacterized protein LOC100205605 isoform X2 [Hydra vulgaris]|uniref:uncharacterized protein LOC100205605 isoform X2 n=1 Tax=Hydra vulgaris TaxID=6087 RepID=UPI001F5F1B94|nr:uncharacterized protein LOC100205605 isoform X2 [Hydra vulgaris]